MQKARIHEVRDDEQLSRACSLCMQVFQEPGHILAIRCECLGQRRLRASAL